MSPADTGTKPSLCSVMPRARILFLAHLLPWPLTDGGRIKSYHTIRHLSERYDVTLMALVRHECTPSDIAGLTPLTELCAGGVSLHYLKRSRHADLFGAARALIMGASFLIARDFLPSLNNAVRGALKGDEGAADVALRSSATPTCDPMAGKYDAVHLDHLQMAQYIPYDCPPLVKVVLDQHNVEHELIRRLSDVPDANPAFRWYARMESRKLRAIERDAIQDADATLAVSDTDRDAFRALAPDVADRIETVPIGVDTDYFAVAERRPGADAILSIGTMSWLPNIDAMRWFASEILPLIRRAWPEARVLIVGANPTAVVRTLAERDALITVTGTVPDVRPYAKECGVFVVPLRAGSGVRVKILNALAMGLPVISTTLGAEGIPVTDGVDILLADSPHAFADAVLRVLNDTRLASRLGANGRALVERQARSAAAGQRLHAVYERVLGATTKSV